MECVNECSFMRFGDGTFKCKLYECDLRSEKSITVETSEQILIHRCQKCIDEGEIGTNTVKEDVRKLKQHLGWVMDSFYSFKDDIETEATNIYRLLKTIEERSEDESK